MCRVVCPPLRIRKPHPVSQRLAVHKSDEERKTDAGKDRSDTPARSAFGKATGIYPLLPIARQRAAVRGFRIAGNVRAGKMQWLPFAHKTGACTSYIATAGAPQPLVTSRQFRDGAIARSLHPRTMGKSSGCRPLFALQDT